VTTYGHQSVNRAAAAELVRTGFVPLKQFVTEQSALGRRNVYEKYGNDRKLLIRRINKRLVFVKVKQ
jgi:hypothetical protein